MVGATPRRQRMSDVSSVLTRFFDFAAGQSFWTPLATLSELGGPVVLILLALSVVAFTIAFVKLWQFALAGLERSRLTEAALSQWRDGQWTSAMQMLYGRRRPMPRVVWAAMCSLARDDLDVSLAREEVTRVAAAELEQLRGFLRPLEVIATLSPLLGLLGTVLGMIEAFQQLESAGRQVDPAVLSGGIWQALLTTAVGLAVAIPVLIMHHWLERRVERFGLLLEDAVTRVFTQRAVSPADVDADTDAPTVEDGH